MAGHSLAEAIRHYRAGRLAEAELICGVIVKKGSDGEALHLSAAIALQQGRLAEAEEQARRAIQARPKERNFYNTLGVILRRLGRPEEARACYLQVLALSADDADALFNLANVLADLGEAEEAIGRFRQALERQPDYLPAHLNLGHLHRRLGRWEEASRCFEAGIAGVGEASELLFGLALSRLDQGRCQEALTLLVQVIGRRPDDAEAHFYAGNALYGLGRVAAAEAEHRLCLSLKPDYARAWNNLGNDLRDQGRLGEARQAYRRALELKPDYMRARSNLLLALHYDEGDPHQTFREHLRWDEAHAAELLPDGRATFPDADPDRRIRIGYLSPDFREHSVAYFIEPVLAACDRRGVELFCYSDVRRPDAMTCRLKGHADQWRDISPLGDAEVATMIRRDGIDILVDLAGHTSHHRLLVFARKPAPLQLTYLGYPATTGMAAMDYRVVDPLTDPAGSEAVHSERLLRLAGPFLCYSPPAAAPEVASPPCLRHGQPSFGSFNHLSKVTEAVVAVWSRILLAVPGSRLVLKHISLQDPTVRQRYLNLFAAHGIDGRRIVMPAWSASVHEHLRCYAEVDVALDTFPYNGTTTTCEALWMGVPVIARAGGSHVSRVGLSLLTHAGLGELVAEDVDGYVERAVALATDADRLVALRGQLRRRVGASPLCDSRAMAVRLVRGYRDIWRRYCARQP